MKKHADIELGHSAYTDNDGLSSKVALRKKAIERLDKICVLDLFAGENKIWSKIKTDSYLGIEKEKGKGKNIYADNRLVIPGLDLSKYTVIDCDAYGIPYEQIQLLYENGTMRSGTVIIYTCISGTLNRLSVRMLKDYGLQEEYKRSRVLYNPYSSDMFHAMLHTHGVNKVFCYKNKKTMEKEYGYFFVK